MTRHEDVYYTCNGCGNRIDGGPRQTDDHIRTVVKVINTDPAALEPEHVYDLCASCWLDVYPKLDRQRIERERREAAECVKKRLDYDGFCYDNPGFEG